MAIPVEVVDIEDSLGIILPREVLEELRIEVGDVLYLTTTPSGIQLSRNAPVLAGKLEVAQQFMREDRDAPNRLAE